MDKTDAQHDVIVIGAGIAGLVAANRAAQLGKRVVVLEKSEDQRYLCNSRYTYGTFHINFTDVGADEDVLVAKIDACSAGVARKDLARAVAKDGRRLMQWLKNEGIDLVDLGGYQTNVLAPPWRTGSGLNWRGYSGDVALERLEENLRRRQGRMLRGMRARALRLASGAIEVETDAAAASQFRAPSVVIADGGFQASYDLIRAHICAAPEKLLARNGGSATGDGLRMAEALGAATTGLDMFYGHLHSRDAMQSPSRLWPRPFVDEIAAASIVIDADGRRFADEGLGGIYLSNAVARLVDPLGATIIFDQAVWDGAPGRGHAQPPNPLLPEAGGTLHRAGTIAELAGPIGIAPQRLKDLVRDYNAAIDAGTLHLLSPPRRSDRHKPWPIRTAPFFAMPICAAITNTMGGIVVNRDGAVLDRNDTPVPGLFAAGSTVGGLEGGPNAGYVGGLIKATIALRAAEAIAASGQAG